MNYRQPFDGAYPITQKFGDKYTDPNGHAGIDYGCPIGTPILASEAGTVSFIGNLNTGYGKYVMIKHDDGNTTLYAHLSVISVTLWQTVKKGQVIGYSGSTGNSTGPHLHFEVRGPDGKPFDPMDLPLHSEITPAPIKPVPVTPPPLKNADQLGKEVEVVCTLGAKGWNSNFIGYTVFPQGTDLTFTGKTKQHNGYTYCECYPAPRMYWVAVNDGKTQILDNRE